MCQAFFQDRNHRFHDLWGDKGWVVRQAGGRACWDDSGGGWNYFDSAWWGKDCRSRNWYTGNNGALGAVDGGPTKEYVHPHFTESAPALLGFDESIDAYCAAHGGSGQHAEACVKANVNILSLYGNQVPYNICRNIEWMICAAKGTLPGQGPGTGLGPDGQGQASREDRTIRFAYAPKRLEIHGGVHPLGGCNAYAPNGCGKQGYASSDIYFVRAAARHSVQGAILLSTVSLHICLSCLLLVDPIR
jgi:hypothetical protein